MNIRQLLGILLFMALNFTGAWEYVWAHGGGTPQLTNVEAGPYRVSVWSLPEPMRVGDSHFTVAVSKPEKPDAAPGEAGSPVFDAKVELQLTPVEGGGQPLVIPATHESAVNKLFYEGDVDLPAAGLWRVAVSVEGSRAVSFELNVLPPAGTNWVFWAGLALCFAVVAGLALRQLGVWRT